MEIENTDFNRKLMGSRLKKMRKNILTLVPCELFR